MACQDRRMITTFINSGSGSGKEAFNAFIDTHLDVKCCPDYAVALYTADRGEHCAIARSEVRTRTHPEVKIIEHFTTLLANTKLDPAKIELFLTCSPCDDCCQKIIEFLDTAGLNLEVEIVFASISYVNQTSRDEHKGSGGQEVSSHDQKGQLGGLRELNRKPRVALRTISKHHWDVLVTALVVADRQEEDSFLEEDFKRLIASDSC